MNRGWFLAGIASLTLGWGTCAQAGDLKINLPERGHMTPVQRLNREGVEAVRKHDYNKAETCFYKAYLLDPDDPFTLNNLGYVSELQGQVDRAQRFYTLASEQSTDAVIDYASSSSVKGRSMKEALALPDKELHSDADNLEAVRLLSEGRSSEADILLERALKNDPHNAFTLNNLGVAKEMEGETQEALRNYDAAALAGLNATATVTLSATWRGKPLRDLAARNARNLRNRLATETSTEARVVELNLRGVSAVNRNDLSSAENDFRQAYSLDPRNPFALNNIGYVAEIEGDRETAQFFYDQAQAAGGGATVGLATKRSAEGLKLFQVASDNDADVQTKIQQQRDIRRGRHEPAVLRRRDNSVVNETTPTNPPLANPPQQ
jgi:Flp pilus assembly protein TadD